MRLDYFRSNGGESLASAVIRFGADQKIVLAATPDGEVRGARIDVAIVNQLKTSSQLSLMEVPKDTAALPRETILSTDGLSRAADQLLKACRA
jgi:hypothetical protein